jgi:hypothetical protein
MIGDIIFTFINVGRMQKTKEYGDKWMYYESNGLLCFAWKKFGFVKGTTIAGITFPLILTIIYYLLKPNDLLIGVWGGMYVMVYMSHLRWHDHLNDLKKRNTNGLE